MEAQSIQEYERLEKYYWWFVGRRHIITRVLGRFFSGQQLRILDWGCGPGGNFSFLQKFGDVTGVDASEEALAACRRKGITNLVQAATLDEFHPKAPFDLIVNLDVLEHIPADQAYVQSLHRVLRPGGYLLVTVPAYQFLWSKLDEVLGHHRRYTRRALKKTLRDNGFEVLTCSYFIFFLSPAFILYRLWEKLTSRTGQKNSLKDSVVKLPGPINWLFTKLLALEAFLIPYISFPFGTSLVAVAQLMPASQTSEDILPNTLAMAE